MPTPIRIEVDGISLALEAEIGGIGYRPPGGAPATPRERFEAHRIRIARTPAP